MVLALAALAAHGPALAASVDSAEYVVSAATLTITLDEPAFPVDAGDITLVGGQGGVVAPGGNSVSHSNNTDVIIIDLSGSRGDFEALSHPRSVVIAPGGILSTNNSTNGEAVTLAISYDDTAAPGVSSAEYAVSSATLTVALAESVLSPSGMTLTDGTATISVGPGSISHDSSTVTASLDETARQAFESLSHPRSVEFPAGSLTDMWGNSNGEAVSHLISYDDTAAPGVSSAEYAVSSATLTVALAESVLSPSGMTLTDGTATISVGPGSISHDSSTVTASLDETARQAFESLSHPRSVEFPAGSLTDMWGNSNGEAVSHLISYDDTAAPGVSSAEYAVSSATLTVALAESVLSPSGMTLTDGTATISVGPGSISHDSSTVTASLDETARQAFESLSHPRSVEFPAGSLTDMWGNSNGEAVSHTISYDDTAAPGVSSAEYAVSSATLTVALDESVLSPSGMTLTDGTATISVGPGSISHDSSTVTASLDETARQAFESLSHPRSVEFPAGSLTDMWGNSNGEAVSHTISYDDTAAPGVSSAEYAVSSATLTVALDESVLSPSGMTLTDGTATISVGPGSISHDSSTVTASLDETARQAFESLSHPRSVEFPAGSLTDMWGNSNGEAVSHTISYDDTAAPGVSSAEYAVSSATLTVALDESVLSPSGMTLTDGTATISVGPGSISHDSSTVAVSLDETARQAFESLSHPRSVEFPAGSLTDMWGNSNGEAVSHTISYDDTTPPYIESATYNISTGTLAVELSEGALPIDTVMLAGGQASIIVQSVAHAHGADGFEIHLAGDDRTAFEGMPEAGIRLRAGTVYDIWNNHNPDDIAGTISRTGNATGPVTPPDEPEGIVLVPMTAEYDLETRILSVNAPATFRSVDMDRIVLHDDSSHLMVSNPARVQNMPFFVIPLSLEDETEFLALDIPRSITVMSGGFTYLADNSTNLANVTATITYGGDTTPPRMVSATYDTRSGDLTVRFSERVLPAPADKILLGNITIDESMVSHAPNSLTVSLPEQARERFAAMAPPRSITMSPGGIADAAGNSNAADITRAIDYAGDTSPPGILYVRYDDSSGALAVELSEAILAPAIDKIRLEYNSTSAQPDSIDHTPRAASFAIPLGDTAEPPTSITVMPGGIADVWGTSNVDTLAHNVTEVAPPAEPPITPAEPPITPAEPPITPAVISSATYDVVSGTLNVTLTEDILTILEGKIHAGAFGTIPPGSLSHTEYADSFEVALDGDHMDRFASLTPPRTVTIAPGGLVDSSGRINVANITGTIGYTDGRPPAIVSAVYNSSSGALAVALSEAILAPAIDKIRLEYNSTSAQPDSIEHTPRAASFAIPLGDAAEPPTSITVMPGGIADVWGTSNVDTLAHSVTEVAPPAEPPTTSAVISSATYDVVSGTLNVTLTEDILTILEGKIHAGAFGTIPPGSLSHTEHADSFEVALDGDHMDRFASLTPPRTVTIAPGGLVDSSGRINVANITGTIGYTDGHPPAIVSAVYNSSSGALNTSLSEAVLGPDVDTIFLEGGSGSLAISAVTHMSGSDSFAVTLANDAKAAFEGMPHPRHLIITLGGLTDIWDNSNTANLTSAISYSDTMPPSIKSATYNMTSGKMTVSLSEDVLPPAGDKISVSGPRGKIATSSVVHDGDAFTVLLSGTGPDGRPLQLPSTVTIASGGITDISANSNTADLISSVDIFRLGAGAAGAGAFMGAGSSEAAVAQSDSHKFKTKWIVAQANTSITIPVGGYGGTYTVDWGDGNITTQSGDATHTYKSIPSGYRHEISISGDFKRFWLGGDSSNAAKLVDVTQWGNATWQSMSEMFEGAIYLNQISAADAPDLSGVTDMSGMFSEITGSFVPDLSSWDVSGVTDMSGMFQGSYNFNGDISSWDVSKVTDMSYMFERSGFNGNISAWDVSSVTDMSYIFSGIWSFNADISAWDVSKVTNMNYMLESARSFNGNISAWDVSKVTSMNSIFSSARSFNGDISSWDVSKATNMGAMFRGATAFNGNISSWDVSKVTNMNNMFSGATAFNGDISSWDVSKVTNMNNMFNGATAFNGDISSWDVSKVTNMNNMFNGATAFKQNLGPWYVVLVDRQIANTNTIGNMSAQNQFLTNQNPAYSLVAGTGDGDNSYFTITTNTLSFKQGSPYKSSYDIRIGAAGSNLFGANSSVSVTIQQAPAEFQSASYRSDSGILAVYFTKPLNTTAHDASKIHVRESGASSGGVTLSNGIITNNGTSSITFDLDGTDTTTVNAMTTPQLDIDAGAVRDLSNNPISAASDRTVSVTDTAPPEFSAAAYYTGNGTLVVSFTEALNRTAHDASKIHVRESGASSGGVTLSNGIITNNGTSSITFDLDGTDTATVNAMTTPQLDIDAGAVRDLSNNPISAASDRTVSVTDTAPPEFSSAMYHAGNGTLVVSFSEALNRTAHDASKIHVRESGASSGGVTLSNGIITNNGTSSITFDLDGTDTATVNAMTTPQLDIDAGAVRDLSNNTISTASDRAVSTGDTAPPEFSSAAYYTGNGTLVVSFSEALNRTAHDASKIHVRESGASSGGVTLSNGIITNNGTSSITFDLDGTDTATVNTMTTPQLDIDAGAVRDLSNNTISAAADRAVSVTDTTPPEFSAAAYYTGNGTLVVSFTEALNRTAHDASNIHMRESGASSGGVTLSNGIITNNGTSSITFDLDGTDTATVNAMTTPQLDIDAGAVQDAAGNPISAAANQQVSTVQPGTYQFKTKWIVAQANTPITIPVGGYGGTYTVNWGDGNTTTQSGDATHTYKSIPSGYRHEISISGDFKRFWLGGDSSNAAKLVDVTQWGNATWQSMSEMFEGAIYLNQISAADAPDLSGVTDMSGMFSEITGSFVPDLSSWDVSGVTDMSGMFQGSYNFNGDISSWDVSKVTDMSYMFERSGFNGNISAWDVSSVTDMSYIFSGIWSFNADISAWDVSKVTNMNYMFESARSFNGNISSWDVSKATNMGTMFRGATSFNGNISSWDVSKVTNMNNMFNGATSFNGNISSWDVSKVTNMNNMFNGATSFNGDISSWDVSKVTNMNNMFNGATSFKQNLGPWYVVLVDRQITNTNTIGNMSAQNQFLTNQNPAYSLVAGTGDGDNSYFTITTNTLSFKQGSPYKSSYDIRIGAAGSNLFGANSSVSVTIQQAPAEFQSASYRSDSGILAVYFTKPLNTTAHDASKIHVRESGASSGGVTLSNGIITNNGTSSITFDLDGTDTATVNAMTTPQLDIDAGAVRDLSNNPISAASDLTVSTSDTAPPEFSSAAYYTGNGTLVVSFTEALNRTAHDASKIHVRESGASSGGVTLSNGIITNNGTSSITFDLDGTDTSTVNAMTTPQLDIDAGAVRDLSNNTISAASDRAVYTSDTAPPEFSSSMYQAGNGTLVVSFSEALNRTAHDASKIHVRESGASSGGVTLSNGIITNNGTSSITFDLDGTDTSTVNAMTTPQLDIDAGAVRDLSNNPISAASDLTVSTSDTAPPEFSSAAYYTGNGTLVVSFTEALNRTAHDASKIHVRESGASSGGVTLSNGIITNNGTSSITFDLDGTDTSTVNAMTTPQLDIDAGAVRDLSNNTISAASDRAVSVTDTAPPEFSAAAYHAGNGTLVVSFTEALNRAAHDASKIHVRESGASSGGVTLSNGIITNNGTSSITFDLDGTDTATVNAMTTPQLDIDAGAVQDAAGNPISAAANHQVSTVQPDTYQFKTKWIVAQANTSITIPVGGYGGTYTVDWGDGNITTQSGDATHTYKSIPSGYRHDISISGDFKRFWLGGDSSSAAKLVEVTQWGNATWQSMSEMFEGAINLDRISADDTPDLSGVTDMSGMFQGAQRFGLNAKTAALSGWNVSGVTDMSYMFQGAYNFKGDIPSWDVSKVTDMSHMFERSGFNGDISSWDVSKVTDMSHMFSSNIHFNGNISAWDVSRVTNMDDMFSSAIAFNGDISRWDVSKVTGMVHMFSGAIAFNGNISAWDVSRVTNMHSMFNSAIAFNGDISRWDVSKVTGMVHMFSGATAFNGNISAWDVSGVTTMQGMFRGATAFNGNISAWDVSGVTTMQSMFGNATAFNGDVSRWNVSGVTNMAFMFSNATAFNGDISRWNVSGVTTMAAMFRDAASFNNDISGWSISKTYNMESMFENATSFKQNLGPWYVVMAERQIMSDTSKIGDISTQNSFLKRHNSTYSLVNGSGSDHNSYFEISGATLSTKQGYPYKIYYNIRIGAAGDALFGINNSIPITLQKEPVEFQSASYYTGNGTFVVSFTNHLNATATDVSKLHIRDINRSSGGITLSNDTITKTGADSITFDLNDTSTVAVNSMDTPQLDIESGAVLDLAGNLISAAVDRPVTVYDTIPPRILYAAFYAANDTLALKISEGIRPTASGNLLISGALSPAASPAHPSGDSILLTLNDTERAAFDALPYPRNVTALTLTDIAGNTATNSTAALPYLSDTPPSFDSATYYTGNGSLTVWFTQPLNRTAHDTAKMHVRDTNQTSGGITLSNSMIVDNGTYAITFDMDRNDTDTVNSMATPELDIDSGAVRDPAGNLISAAADRPITVVDTIPPSFKYAVHHIGDGTLVVEFDEHLDPNAFYMSQIHIRDINHTTGGVTLSNEIMVPNGAPAGGASGASAVNITFMTFYLNNSDNRVVGDMDKPELDIDYAAVSDLSGNPITTSHDRPIDLIYPYASFVFGVPALPGSAQSGDACLLLADRAGTYGQLMDASYDRRLSVMTLVFDLAVNASTVNLAGLSVSSNLTEYIHTHNTTALDDPVLLTERDSRYLHVLLPGGLPENSTTYIVVNGTAVRESGSVSFMHPGVLPLREAAAQIPLPESAYALPDHSRLYVSFSEPIIDSETDAAQFHIRDAGQDGPAVTLDVADIILTGSPSLLLFDTARHAEVLRDMESPVLDVGMGATLGAAGASSMDATAIPVVPPGPYQNMLEGPATYNTITGTLWLDVAATDIIVRPELITLHNGTDSVSLYASLPLSYTMLSWSLHNGTDSVSPDTPHAPHQDQLGAGLHNGTDSVSPDTPHAPHQDQLGAGLHNGTDSVSPDTATMFVPSGHMRVAESAGMVYMHLSQRVNLTGNIYLSMEEGAILHESGWTQTMPDVPVSVFSGIAPVWSGAIPLDGFGISDKALDASHPPSADISIVQSGGRTLAAVVLKNDTGRLGILDATDPGRMTPLSYMQFDHAVDLDTVSVDGVPYAMALNRTSIHAINLMDPASPTRAATIPYNSTYGGAIAATVRDGVPYLSYANFELWDLLDMSVPSNPQTVYTAGLASTVDEYGAEWSGGTLLGSFNQMCLHVLDTENIRVPTFRPLNTTDQQAMVIIGDTPLIGIATAGPEPGLTIADMTPENFGMVSFTPTNGTLDIGAMNLYGIPYILLTTPPNENNTSYLLVFDALNATAPILAHTVEMAGEVRLDTAIIDGAAHVLLLDSAGAVQAIRLDTGGPVR